MTKYKPIQLPEDSNAHKNIVEWWYFNGHLKDRQGKRYSFMDCLFQADLKRINVPLFRKIPFRKYAASFVPFVYSAHSIISDLSRQKNYKDIQPISIISRESFKKPMLFANYRRPFAFKGYSHNLMAQTAPDAFHIKTERLDLNLTAKKPVLLEQGKGYVECCGRESFYYSYTDLRAQGTLTLDGKGIEVEGKAWADHQWTDVDIGKDKWSWFSVQLEDGTDLMLAEYDDHKSPGHLVDIMYKNGETEHFRQAVFKPVKDIKSVWKSKKTKAEYPLAWQILIPDKDIIINARAAMKDQEMIFGDINYWEGPLEVTALISGKKVSGVGFMELMGYPSDYNFVYLTLSRK